MVKKSMDDLLKRRMSAAQQASELEVGNEAYETMFQAKADVAAPRFCELPIKSLCPFRTADIGFRPYPPEKLRAFSQQLAEQGIYERIMKGIPIWHRMSFSSAAMKNRMMRFWVQQSSTTMLWKLTTVSSLPFSTKRSMAMSFYSRLMPRLPRRISGRKLIEGNCKKLQQLPIFL